MNKIKVIKKSTLSDGFLKTEKLELEVPKFNGQSMLAVREIAKQNSSVFLLPYDHKTQQVLIISQHRPGLVYESSTECYETIAGRLDKKLTPEQTVIAEAYEEAGLNIEESNLNKIGNFPLSPGGSTEIATIFTVNCDLSKIIDGSVHGNLHENEDIKTHIMTINDALELVNKGCNVSATLQLALCSIKAQFH